MLSYLIYGKQNSFHNVDLSEYQIEKTEYFSLVSYYFDEIFIKIFNSIPDNKDLLQAILQSIIYSYDSYFPNLTNSLALINNTVNQSSNKTTELFSKIEIDNNIPFSIKLLIALSILPMEKTHKIDAIAEFITEFSIQNEKVNFIERINDINELIKIFIRID